VDKRKRFHLAVIGLIFFLFISLRCDWPLFFKRNSNLKLLLAKDGYSMFNPAWSPDGKMIYYLMLNLSIYGGGYIDGYGGQLRAIDIDGSNDKLILDGTFGSLAISPSGSKLALTCGNISGGGDLIIVDTSGNILDTLVGQQRKVVDVEFNEKESAVYYFVLNEGFFKMNMASLIEDTVFLLRSETRVDLDIWKDSLLIFSNKLLDLLNDSLRVIDPILLSSDPQFSPFCAETIVSAQYDEFIITDLKNNKEKDLNALPYWASFACFPYWSPDGEKIVFSASKMRTGDLPSRPTYFELWILEKID
jgi:WD40-like Beta Propeller Repeat